MKRAAILIISLAILFMPGFFLKAAEQFKYDAHGKRDPFVPLIGQEKAVSSIPLAEIASIDDIKLEGIANMGAGKRTAIMNGELVKENYKAGEIVIKKIMKDSVVLTIGDKEYTVSLSEEGGLKE